MVTSAARLAVVVALIGLLSAPPATAGPGAPTAGESRTKYQSFRSRPDLQPPIVRVTTARQTAPGYVFVAPKGPGQDGPMIIDNKGQVVWFDPLPDRLATQFRVREYRGQPVITWWQGRPIRGWGRGVYVIADSAYNVIARIRAKRTLDADLHDMTLTDEGTALVTAYRAVPQNLRPLGGAKRGLVLDSVIQEIDIATGELLFEWHSIDHVPIRYSYEEPHRYSRSYDYFHINSVAVDNDGNLLVSARNMRTVYKINRRTGRIIWRLGGKHSSFKMGPGTRFAWQHDARRLPNGDLTIFDNGASPPVRKRSRAIVLSLNTASRRATLVRSYTHPLGLLSSTQGNIQVLPNGNAFVGWGSRRYFSEFDSHGNLLFDGRLSRDYDTYRAFRFEWTGRPPTKPAIAVGVHSDHTVTVYASWNGATDVAAWRVLAGSDPDQLHQVTTAPRTGFETPIRALTRQRYVAVQALDRTGGVLGSRTVKL